MRKTGPPLLEFRDVTVLRRGRRALDRLTLRIGTRENVAILGPNGSGKSTFVKLLTREVYPAATEDDTRVRILGRDRWELLSLRRRLGIVTTDLQADFTREISAWETVISGFFGAYGLFLNHRVTAAQDRRVRQVFRRLEIAPLLERPMCELSTGEARRVMIARALVHGPGTLLLDEPTNSLDLRAHREFRAAMRRLARGGTRLLLVTHALEDLVPEIGRVVLLREGRVFRDGPAAHVLTDAHLSDLYRMPLRVRREGGFWRVS